MPFVLGDPTQTSPEIHTGDEGTQFIVTIYDQDENPVNVSSATNLVIRFDSPSHVVTDKTALPYMGGTNGKIIYTVESGLFNESGEWNYQAILTFSSGTWYTNIRPFTVYANIPDPSS